MMLFVATAGGCAVIRNEFRTLVSEPAKYSDNLDIVRTKFRTKRLAKEYFVCFQTNHADTPTSSQFRDGFVRGFADYLTFGGSGTPPVLPPRRFWKVPGRSPAGHGAVQDWFAGFAAGATEAKLSGLREQQTVAFSYAPTEGVIDLSTSLREEWAEPPNRPPELLPVPESSRQQDRRTPLREATELAPLLPGNKDQGESSSAPGSAEFNGEDLPMNPVGPSPPVRNLEESGPDFRSSSSNHIHHDVRSRC